MLNSTSDDKGIVFKLFVVNRQVGLLLTSFHQIHKKAIDVYIFAVMRLNDEYLSTKIIPSKK